MPAPETPFQIETFIPGLGPWDFAEADTPENAFFAVETLLKECGTMHAYAEVRSEEDGLIWRGEHVATRARRSP